MRRYIIFILSAVFCTTVSAQHPTFNPQAYQAELEQFITREACLTPQEAATFFPLFRAMQRKQRTLFDTSRQERHAKPADDEACRNAIIQRDDNVLQIKAIQQQYHLRFMSVLSPSKVYDILRAEDQFHRQSFQNAARKRNKAH